MTSINTQNASMHLNRLFKAAAGGTDAEGKGLANKSLQIVDALADESKHIKLKGAEVDRLIDAAKANRWGHRDATMILVAFRHGLRSSELVDLRWDQIDFSHAVLHVRRAKKGTPATHPIVGDESGPCASCSGSKSPSRRSCSRRPRLQH